MAKTKATPTEKYWKKRQEELEKKWDKKSREEIERELRAYYEQSLTHIEKDIRALYQRFATDNGMDMAAAQQLLTGKEYRVWRMDIAEYVKEIHATGNPELLRELNTLAMRSRITRLDALRAGTLKEMALLSKKTEKAMKEFLKSGYEDFYYHGLYEIGKKRGLEGAVSLVDGDKLERVLRVPWSGKNYSKRIWSNGAKLAKTIQQNIIAAAHRGVSVQDMTRVVRQKMGVGTKEAVRLVRTELNYVQNQAALHSIKDAGMKYYRFIATLDKRTSTICQSHDGDVFPVEEAQPGKNMPPLHPHCRSVISGCLKGEHKPQSGTRIARDENGKNVFVPANMKYDDWRAVYVDKKLTLEEWEAGNVASQATNATGALNAGAQSGTMNMNQIRRFIPSKTVSGAEDYARSVLGIPNVSYKGCDVDTANAWNRGLYDAFSRFPELKKNFGFVGEVHERNAMLKPVLRQHYADDYRKRAAWLTPSEIDQLADAATRKTMKQLQVAKGTLAVSFSESRAPFSEFRGVSVNREYGKDAKKFAQALTKDVGSKFHPIGCDSIRSVLDHEIGHQLDKLLGIRDIQIIKDLFDSRTHAEMSDALSKYAWDNKNRNRYAEMIAEAWAEYCNNPKPRDIAKIVGKTIEAEYQKRFGKGGGTP